MYRLIVGTKNWSSWSLRPYLAIRATGAPFEEITIALRRADTRAQIRRLTPSHRVPVLFVTEGEREFAVFDSLAICEALAERHPEAGLWPVDPSARARARSISAAMHSGFAPLRETLSMEFARRLPTPPLGNTVLADIEEITGYWQEALDARHGQGEFLFGRFSIADCMYAPVVSRFRTYGISLPAPLQEYCDLIWGLPAMQDWLSAAEAEVRDGLLAPAT
ncbi:MAG TPA: glutathione S-transferase [Rhizomicrobium sp.]|nr:glutathione S-transferase [Rhizomicrobium sp.]